MNGIDTDIAAEIVGIVIVLAVIYVARWMAKPSPR
jgi:hypothetical protein